MAGRVGALAVAGALLAASQAAAQFVPYAYRWAPPPFYPPPAYGYVRPFLFRAYPPPPYVVAPPTVVVPYPPPYVVPYAPPYAVAPVAAAPVWRPRVVYRPAARWHRPRELHRASRVTSSRAAAARRRPANPLFGPLPGR